MLEFTAYVGRDKELAKVARVLRKEKTPWRPCTRRARWVHEHLTYQPGSTGVHTSALEAWEAGKGVCQDYVHLTLLLLREAGIPARYVSGYLLPKADAEVKQTVTGESHAWVEAWTGRVVGLRPDEPDRDRPAARVGRERPRLRTTSRRSRASTPVAPPRPSTSRST